MYVLRIAQCHWTCVRPAHLISHCQLPSLPHYALPLEGFWTNPLTAVGEAPSLSWAGYKAYISLPWAVIMLSHIRDANWRLSRFVTYVRVMPTGIYCIQSVNPCTSMSVSSMRMGCPSLCSNHVIQCCFFSAFVHTVEPLYNGHHWDTTFCPLQRGVPNSGVCVIFSVGMVPRNLVVKQRGCVFRAFLCCTLAGKAKQRLVLQVTALI